MRKWLTVFIISYTLFTASCTNLREVNGYSAEALIGLSQFENLNYNFTTYCLDQCQIEAVKEFQIKRELQCECTDFQLADSTTQQLYLALYNYWDGLYLLTGNQLTQYDLSSTATLLENDKIKLEPDHISAYQRLTEMILRAGTDGYRKRQVRKFVADSHEHINVLSEKLAFILEDNLHDLLAIEMENWYGYYASLSFSENLSDFEKGLMVTRYYEKLAEAEKKQALLKIMAEIILKLAEGHRELNINNVKLSGSDLKDWARSSAGDLKELYTSFNQLKD